jgi:hypothetical protein
MRARLIGIELLTIEPIDRTALSASSDGVSLEPSSNIPRGAAIVVPAQLDEVDTNRRRPSQGGAKIAGVYDVTMLVSDLERLGYNPKDGDLVTTITDRRGQHSRTVHLYLQGVHRSGKDSTAPRGQLVVGSLGNRAASRVQDEGI